MDYDALFTGSLETLKADGSYRHFAQLERSVGRFPAAWHRGANRKVTVWCSNDYCGADSLVGLTRGNLSL
jgi:5-aminolevulinate synthase